MIMKDKKVERILWIDVAKAIGTILVVLGHLCYVCSSPKVNQAIYSFHVPLFFFLSGFVITRHKNETLTSFFKSKFFRLIFPAFIYIVLFLPIYFVYQNPHSISGALRKIFFVDGFLAFNDPCWFLIVLFEVLLLERVIDAKSKPLYIKVILVAIFLIIGFFVYSSKLYIPFGINKALTVFVFVVFGEIVSEVTTAVVFKSKGIGFCYMASMMILCGCLCYIFGMKFNSKVSLYSMDLGNYWYFVLSSIFGTIFVCLLCGFSAKLLEFLSIVGKCSIFILGTHYLPVFYFCRLAELKHFKYTFDCDIMCMIVTIAIIAFSIPIHLLLKKYAPVVVGEKFKRRKNNL